MTQPTNEEHSPTSQSLQNNLALRHEMPTVWADGVQFAVRKTAGAEVVLMTFVQSLPFSNEGINMLEASRVITTVSYAKKWLDSMCKRLDYYPERPAESNAEDAM